MQVMPRQCPDPGAHATGSSDFLFLEQPGGEKPGAVPDYPETSLLRGSPAQPRGKAAWRDSDDWPAPAFPTTPSQGQQESAEAIFTVQLRRAWHGRDQGLPENIGRQNQGPR